MGKSDKVDKTGFTDDACRALLACAKQFFADPKNQKGFEKWLAEEEKKEKEGVSNGKSQNI